MSKKVNVNYRKICKEHYGYTDKQMKNMKISKHNKNKKSSKK